VKGKMEKTMIFLLILLIGSSTGLSIISIKATTYFHSDLLLNEILIDRIEITDAFSGFLKKYELYVGIKTERHFDNFGELFMANDDYEDALSTEAQAYEPEYSYYGYFYGGFKPTITNPLTFWSYGEEFGSINPGNELQIFIKIKKVSDGSTQYKYKSFGDDEQEYALVWSEEYSFSDFGGALKVKYQVDTITTNNQDFYFEGMDVPLELHKVQVKITKIQVVDGLEGSSDYKLYVGYQWRRHFGSSYFLRMTDDDEYEDTGEASYTLVEDELDKDSGTYDVTHYGDYSYAEPLGANDEDGQFKMFVKLVKISPFETAYRAEELGNAGQSYETEYCCLFDFNDDFGGTIRIYFEIIRL